MPASSVLIFKFPEQFKMLQFVAVVLVALLGSILANSPFPDFQHRFAEHSLLVEPQLHELRGENNVARLEVTHTIVTKLAKMTVDMRQLSWDTWEYIENHEDVKEECLDWLEGNFHYYNWIGELDIMYAANKMNDYMRNDTTYRFNPRAIFKSRENTRAIYQTVQTLGRNRFMDDLGDTVYELEDQLNYFQNLWESYQDILREEINDLESLKEYIQEEMDYWYEYAMRWHNYTMQSLIENIPAC